MGSKQPQPAPYSVSETMSPPAPPPAFGKPLAVWIMEAENMRKRIATLETENKRLAGIVEKLPKTRDGAPIVPRMWLYCPHGHPVYIPGLDNVSCRPDGKTDYYWRATECYSTEVAALAAKEGNGNGSLATDDRPPLPDIEPNDLGHANDTLDAR